MAAPYQQNVTIVVIWIPGTASARRPGLTPPLSPEAYLLNVYTEPAHRRQGVARALIETVLEWCRAEGLTRVALHASDAGRPVYEALGFLPTNELRRDVDL